METPEKKDGLVPYQTRAPQPQPPAKALTRHQRATVYFKALRYVRSLLNSVGFRDEADVGHSGFCIAMDGFILEMVVKEPPMMAHVTSYPGYEYDPKKINAKVTMMVPTEGRDYVVQVIATTSDMMTQMPVFIVMRQDSPDLLRETFVNCLMSARDLMRKDPKILAKIQAALAKKDIERELEMLKAQDESRQLGHSSAP